MTTFMDDWTDAEERVKASQYPTLPIRPAKQFRPVHMNHLKKIKSVQRKSVIRRLLGI